MNARRVWFKRKQYGWGWTPATWEGWLVLGIYTGALVSLFMKIDDGSPSASDALTQFIPLTLLLTLILLAVSYWKGERPKWQGKSDE